jgi:hypothetical protein
MTRTAYSISRTGMARAHGDSLIASNEPIPPSESKLWQDRSWRYFKADETDITRTWRKAGWVPNARRPS